MKVKYTPEFEESFARLFSDEPRYVVMRWWEFITKGFWRELKYKWQRARRGYSDADTWDMNTYLAGIIAPMLRQIKDRGHGYPGVSGANSPEQWQELLEEMAVGFDAFSKSFGELGITKDEGKELEKKYRKGLKLFAKWYPRLWD